MLETTSGTQRYREISLGREAPPGHFFFLLTVKSYPYRVTLYHAIPFHAIPGGRVRERRDFPRDSLHEGRDGGH